MVFRSKVKYSTLRLELELFYSKAFAKPVAEIFSFLFESSREDSGL